MATTQVQRVIMETPQIATILDDGSYGLRDMTPEEIAEAEFLISEAPQPADMPSIREEPTP